MQLKNCSRCNRVYVSTHPSLCSECLQSDEVDFKKVRDFVKDHPRVSVEVVIEATGVNEERIREFLRQRLLDVADFAGPTLQCQRCGKPIDTGTYCLLCRQDISDTFKSSADVEAKPAGKDKDKTTFARYYRNKR